MILFYRVNVIEGDNPDLIYISHVNFSDTDFSVEIESVRERYSGEPFACRVELLFALPGTLGHLGLYQVMMLGYDGTEILFDEDFPYTGKVKDFVDENMNKPFIIQEG